MLFALKAVIPSTRSRFRRALAFLGTAGILVLAGCGGGGGGGGFRFLEEDNQPRIQTFAPEIASAYSRVDLSGRGFTGATAVTFGGVPATLFVVPDDRTIYAAVPPGAVSGFLAVTTPKGVLTSEAPFQFDPGPATPYLFSILPASGPVGTRVTLRGTQLFSASEVTFGGIPALLPPPSSDSQLEVLVPAGANTGAITVSLPNGLTASSSTFTVAGRPPVAPVIKSFSPASGGTGTNLEVKGANFATVTGVKIGGHDASFFLWNDTRLSAWVPFLAPHLSTLAVTSPSGTGTHPTPFKVVEPKPVLNDFFPQRGAVGMEVTLEGEHLLKVKAVRFGAGRTTTLIATTDHELRVEVPTGATTGPITVEADKGHGASTGVFTVTDTDPGLQVRIMGMFVTQATQRMDGSVPLVANRDGVLRVFILGDRANTVVPAVQVTLHDAHGGVLLDQELHATGSGLPWRLEEGNLAKSWNLPIPGKFLQPGVSVLAKVLPQADLTLPPAGVTFPHNGTPMALTVVKVPPFGIRLIPIVSAQGTGTVTNGTRTLASWMERFKAIYPIDQLDLEEGQPLATTADLSSIMGAVKLRNDLEGLRLKGNDTNRRYYYGVFVKPITGGLLGLGNLPPAVESNQNRSAIGWDGSSIRDGENYSEVLAHEMGHCLNRMHAPCGGAAGPDFNYPYPKGVIGAYGLDTHKMLAKDANLYTDVMGYCSPQWVSDYTYKAVLEWRNRQVKSAPPGGLAYHANQPGLLIWGTVEHGAVTLEPAFDAPEASLPEHGDYTLVCLDAHGHVLSRTPFAPARDPDAMDEDAPGAFAFVIPMTSELRARLDAIQVHRGGAILATLHASAPGPEPGAPAALGREPVATVWGEGKVLLTWDAAAHPRVIVKDAASGQDLGVADGGTVTLVTASRELDLVLSDGLHTLKHRILVRE